MKFRTLIALPVVVGFLFLVGCGGDDSKKPAPMTKEEQEAKMKEMMKKMGKGGMPPGMKGKDGMPPGMKGKGEMPENHKEGEKGSTAPTPSKSKGETETAPTPKESKGTPEKK